VNLSFVITLSECILFTVTTTLHNGNYSYSIYIHQIIDLVNVIWPNGDACIFDTAIFWTEIKHL